MCSRLRTNVSPSNLQICQGSKLKGYFQHGIEITLECNAALVMLYIHVTYVGGWGEYQL
jgi:hypothetical protein